MKLMEPLRLWWQKQTGEEETPFDGDAPAWAVSLLVHMTLLLVLTAIGVSLPEEAPDLVLSTETFEEPQELERVEEVFFSEQEVQQIGANSVNGEQAALALAAIKSDISDVPAPELEAEVGNLVIESPTTIAVAPNVSATMVVRGSATGVGTTGATGAVDRITHEILLSLEQRKTLVVWIFDKSGSLQRQRESVVERFDRVYRELGILEAAKNPAFAKHDDKPLLTTVMAFGQNVETLTKEPTDDLKTIKAAVAGIQNDASGLERVFSAVYEAAKKSLAYRLDPEDRRNVMLIVFTDEAGDDQKGLDTTVNFCRRYQIPVYVVGVPAPFGRREVEIKYVDPNPKFDQTPQWIPVHQGPETIRPERIKLAFSGSKRDVPIDSGFGPYSLTRLCYETGGVYFAVHPNRELGREVSRRETAALSAHLAHFFDPNVMRAYAPDYVTREEYTKRLMSNKARWALVQAAELSWASAMSSPTMTFPKRNQAALAKALSMAQRDAAIREPRLNAIYETLALGEKDRPKLTEPRWQAGYDLAMGRTLAVLVRTKTYNAMLAHAKQGMEFKNKDSDTWVLEPSDKITVSSILEKQAQEAKKYLERVVKEHPGTPWAMLAKRELEQPFGYEWTETHTGVNDPKPAGGGNANPNPNPKRKMLAKPKPKRTPKL